MRNEACRAPGDAHMPSSHPPHPPPLPCRFPGVLVGELQVPGCSMPDNIEWSKDGKRIFLACEGEPATQACGAWPGLRGGIVCAGLCARGSAKAPSTARGMLCCSGLPALQSRGEPAWGVASKGQGLLPLVLRVILTGGPGRVGDRRALHDRGHGPVQAQARASAAGRAFHVVLTEPLLPGSHPLASRVQHRRRSRVFWLAGCKPKTPAGLSPQPHLPRPTPHPARHDMQEVVGSDPDMEPNPLDPTTLSPNPVPPRTRDTRTGDCGLGPQR